MTVALAFEIQNCIDHMLEDPWASDRAFLRHVPDDKDRIRRVFPIA